MLTSSILGCIIDGAVKIKSPTLRQKKKGSTMKKIVLLILTIAMMLTLAVSFTSCKSSDKTDSIVNIIDVNLTDEEYAFVCKKGNTELVSGFNAFLNEIKSDGTFDTLVDKYFKGEGEKVGYDVAMSDVQNTEDNLVVVTNCPFEPFEYIGDDGKIYGLDIEIAAAYAESENLTLVIKNIGFDDIFTQVDAGYADIGMAGITASEDRAAIYDFTNSYYQASQKIIVAAGNTDFDACATVEEVEAILASLQGKKIGYQIGTTGSMYINGDEDWGYTGFANVEGKGYTTAQDALQDLINGNIYAVVVDEAPGTALANAVNGNSSAVSVKIETFISTMEAPYFRKLLINGLINTVKVAVLGLLIGILIGTVIAIIKVAPKYKRINRILDKICSVYVAIFRGTPMVVQLLLAYYVILPLLGVKDVNSIVVGIVVFGMNSGAYVSEIMRGGLNSVDKGQMEAGRALGLSYNTTMLKVVIPQAIKNILPTLGNEFITLIKETSVLSFITVYDLYTALSTIGSKNYEKMVPYIVMAMIYIVLVLMITLLVKILEKTFAKSDRNRANSNTKAKKLQKEVA